MHAQALKGGQPELTFAMPRFVTLVNVEAEKTPQAIEAIKKLTAPEGGKIHSRRALMGRYDLLIEFEAPSENAALDWVVQKLRTISGCSSTETFVIREL